MKISIFHSKTFYLISGLLTIILAIIFLSYIPGGFLFPSIFKIIENFFLLFTNFTFIKYFINSLFTLLITLLLSIIIAAFLGFLHTVNENIDNYFKPFIVFLKCAPIAIIAVYIFLIGGPFKRPYFIIFATVFPLMLEAFYTSINEIPETIKLELKLSNISSIKKYFFVYLPLITPYLAMSFLMTFGLGLKVSIMGEYLLNTKDSLGEYIYNIRTSLEIEKLLAILLFCIFFTITFELIAKFLFKKINRNLFKN